MKITVAESQIAVIQENFTWMSWYGLSDMID